MKKKKCPVQGCREKLTTINTYTCKSCKQSVCLKHRLENDHKCPGKSGAAVAAVGALAYACRKGSCSTEAFMRC
jgi:predicted nucleic acid binding AN1-type Zn finger protein